MKPEFYAEYFRVEDRHWWFIGRRRIVMTRLRANPPLGSGGNRARILDLGCGTGTMLAHLRELGDVAGADADAAAIRFCHARGERRVQLLETEELPFADASWDLITMLDVLEHVEDDWLILREIARVLRPGGRVLITVPAHRWMWGPQDQISHHFRRYAAGELKARVAQAGLTVDRISYFNTLLFPPVALIRVLRRLRPPTGEQRSDFELTSEGGVANRLLAAIFSSEARWLKRWRLPLGVSLLAEARAPGTAPAPSVS